jgi:hypothetical protein
LEVIAMGVKLRVVRDLAVRGFVLAAMACVPEAPRPDEPAVESKSSPVLGAWVYGADCAQGMKDMLDRTKRFGRAAVSTPAFASCLSQRMTNSFTLGGHTSGPYLKCTNDPWYSSPLSVQIDKALSAARSWNDVGMACTGGGGNASAALGTYGHSNPEYLSWGGWLTDVYAQYNPNSPWPASQAAGIVSHEAAHTQGYTHGANDQAAAKVACGYSSHPTWNFQVNTLPYILGSCVEDVLAQSGTSCGGNLETCPVGYVKLIDGVSSTGAGGAPGTQTCSCVLDPGMPGFMIRSDRNSSLYVNAWGGGAEGADVKLANNCTADNPDCTWTYRDGMLLSHRDPTLAMNAWGGAVYGASVRLTRLCTSSNPDCTWTYKNGLFYSDRNPSLAINAWGSAAHGTSLKLHNVCDAANPDCTWTMPHVLLASQTDSKLVAKVYPGPLGMVGGSLKLTKNCSVDDVTCTWTIHKGVIISDVQPTYQVRPSIAVGAVHGAELTIGTGSGCTSSPSSCMWTWSHGSLINDNQAAGVLPVNAWGGAAEGVSLKLHSGCTVGNPDCRFLGQMAGR